MKKVLIFALLFTSITVAAQDFSLYEKHVYTNGNDSLPYRLLLPVNYNPKQKYPLIIFLHGSGERGNDNELQLVHGAKLFIREDIRRAFPAIVIFPQCARGGEWAKTGRKQVGDKFVREFKFADEPTVAMKLLQELITQSLKLYPINKKQVYVGGLSMGGFGTFEIVARNPNLFAAAFPICGGGAPESAPKLKKTRWWIFHGAKDVAVLPELSEVMVKALEKEKASVKFSLYADADHNSWDPAFAEPGLLPWLFKQKR